MNHPLMRIVWREKEQRVAKALKGWLMMPVWGQEFNHERQAD